MLFRVQYDVLIPNKMIILIDNNEKRIACFEKKIEESNIEIKIGNYRSFTISPEMLNRDIAKIIFITGELVDIKDDFDRIKIEALAKNSELIWLGPKKYSKKKSCCFSYSLEYNECNSMKLNLIINELLGKSEPLVAR